MKKRNELPNYKKISLTIDKDKILKEYNYYRQILNSLGYKILWGNVCLDGYGPVEDWWVSEEIYNKYEDNKSDHIDCNEVHNENFIYCTL